MAEKKSILDKQTKIMNLIKSDYNRLEDEKQKMNHGEALSDRRILLLGCSKSGKTTFRQMMRDPTYVSDELRLLARSDNIDFHVIDCQQAGLSLTVVDTHSLSGREDDQGELENIHKAAFAQGITNYHFICYCLSLEAGIHQQDISAVRALITCYGPEIQSNLCMIITRCEMKTEQQRRDMCTQIQRDSSFRNSVRYFGLGIHFSGALKYDDWQNGNFVLCEQFRNVYEYREKLLQLFSRDTQPYYLNIQPKRGVKSSSTPHDTESSKRHKEAVKSESPIRNGDWNVVQRRMSKSGVAKTVDNMASDPDDITDSSKIGSQLTSANDPGKHRKLIEQTQHYYDSHKRNSVVPVRVRNIAIVSTKGIGISNLVHMLVNPTIEEYVHIYPTGNRQKTAQSLFVEGARLVLNMIEIPFDSINPNCIDTESNNDITEIFETCIKSGFARIDLACFMIKQSELLVPDIVETIKDLMAYDNFDFPQLTCLFIADSQSRTLREQTMQLEQSQKNHLKIVKDCFKRGILFADSIRYEEYLDDHSNMMEHFATILHNREKFLDIVLGKYQSFPLNTSFPSIISDQGGFLDIGEMNLNSNKQCKQCKELRRYDQRGANTRTKRNKNCWIL